MSGLLAVALDVLLAADAGAVPALVVPPAPAPNTQPAPPSLIPRPTSRRYEERAPRIDLKAAKDGSGDLLYETSGFTARIAPDGTVTFKDKRISDLSFLPLRPKGRLSMGVPSLQSSLKLLLKGKSPPEPPPSELDQGLPPPETTQLIPEVSRYRPDPREGGCRGCPKFDSLWLNVSGRMDLTDEIMRFSGKDPNRYQKALFLAATHDRRIEMAVKMHAEHIRRAAADLPAELQAIACDERLTRKERRAILAALAVEMDTNVLEGAKAAADITAFLGRFDAGGVTCAKAP
jgi:hypothetical protein